MGFSQKGLVNIGGGFNPEVERLKSSTQLRGEKMAVVKLKGGSPRPLLGSLLARLDRPKVAGVPVPADVVKAMQTVEAYVATLDGGDSKALP